MSLDELTTLNKNRLEEYFFDNARYMPDAPQRPYFIRVGSAKTLFSADTMELRLEFERFVYNARRRKARKKS